MRLTTEVWNKRVTDDGTAFNEFLLDAFTAVSAQVDEWQAVATAVVETLAWYEDELSTRYSTMTEALFELDNDLAEEDHLQAEMRIDEVEEAIDGVDAFLIRVHVLKQVTAAASPGVSLGSYEESIGDAVATPLKFAESQSEPPSSNADIDDDEQADLVVAALGIAAEQVRRAGRSVKETWADAVSTADEGSLREILLLTTLLHAYVRSLRQDYDEWFALLGGLSNRAPDRLTGAARATYDLFTDWYHSPEAEN